MISITSLFSLYFHALYPSHLWSNSSVMHDWLVSFEVVFWLFLGICEVIFTTLWINMLLLNLAQKRIISIESFHSHATGHYYQKIIITTGSNKCWWGCGEAGTCTVGGNVKGCGCCGKQYGGSSKPSAYDSYITQQFGPRYKPPRNWKQGLNRYLHTNIHSGVIPKSQKDHQAKCSSADKEIHQTWHIQATEYSSVLKRKEMLTHATTWMSLEDIMLREISQSQRRQIPCNSIFLRYLR